MGKFKDLTGQKFGRLTVIKRGVDYINPNGSKVVQWLCKCDCGNEELVLVRSSKLVGEYTRSCGCLKREKTAENGKKNKGKSNLKNKKYNTFDLSGEYGIGYTSKGEEFYFDLEDYDKIKDYCWYVDKENYIVTTDSHNKRISFHRLVMNFPSVLVIDHILGYDTRNDNRKHNLRICTQQENIMNCKLSKNNTSGVTGVYWGNRENKWISIIMVNRKQIYLGSFYNFEDAVKARKDAEKKYFGEFSYDNSQNREVV